MDKATLLKPRLPEDDVEIPGVGAVRVRGLSRWEFMTCQREGEQHGALAMEKLVLHFGLVDPALTQDEVVQLIKASPANELAPVVLRIRDLSGAGEGAEKAAYKSDGGQSGA